MLYRRTDMAHAQQGRQASAHESDYVIQINVLGARVTMSQGKSKIIQIQKQAQPVCKSVSFGSDAAIVFMQYPHGTLRHGKMRGGILYGTVNDGNVSVEVVHEPAQDGGLNSLHLHLGTKEAKRADALPELLG
jgi:hypothetical protein